MFLLETRYFFRGILLKFLITPNLIKMHQKPYSRDRRVGVRLHAC